VIECVLIVLIVKQLSAVIVQVDSGTLTTTTLLHSVIQRCLFVA